MYTFSLGIHIGPLRYKGAIILPPRALPLSFLLVQNWRQSTQPRDAGNKCRPRREQAKWTIEIGVKRLSADQDDLAKETDHHNDHHRTPTTDICQAV